MGKKPRIQAEEKTASELVRSEERRQELAKHQSPKRNLPQNLFPFSPARIDRPNPMGLKLDKWDCRILRAVQEHGFSPVRDFCKMNKIPERIFYERFRVNPDLSEAMKLLAFSNLAIAFPKAMATLTEKFPENAKWAELYFKVTGLMGETGESSLRLMKPAEERESRLLTEEEIDRLLLGR